jgi:selenium-binding protein 1
MVTSSWGTPNMVKDGVNPSCCSAASTGTRCTCGICAATHVQELELGAEQQMVLELRPAHDPTARYGFVGVVLSLKDLSSSIWMWYRDGAGRTDRGAWAIKKVIEIPAEPPTREAAADSARVQGGRAARHRHQPVDRRPVPLCVVLGHR